MVASVLLFIAFCFFFMLSMVFKVIASVIETIVMYLENSAIPLYILFCILLIPFALNGESVIVIIISILPGLVLAYFFMVYPYTIVVTILCMIIGLLETIANKLAKLADRGYKKMLQIILNKTSEN